VDAGDFTFYDCAYEELLQGLGAINDDPSVPWTMFNDDVQMGFFDVYDQYLVNILYDPRIRPGMTKAEEEQQARLERARAIGLFRYMLIREAADPALSTRQRGKLVRAIAAAAAIAGAIADVRTLGR